MPQNEVEFQKRFGKDYWWSKAMREFLLTLIISRVQDTTIVDLGCGVGQLEQELDALNIRYLACDIDPISVSYAKQNARFPGDIFCMDAVDFITTLDRRKKYTILALDLWTQETFNAHRLLNIIEEKELNIDLILRFPAYSIFRSQHDYWVNQGKRVNPQNLINELQMRSLKLVYSTHLNLFLIPLFLVVKLLPMKGGLSKRLPKLLNSALYRILILEHKIIDIFQSLPFGLTHVLIISREDPSDL